MTKRADPPAPPAPTNVVPLYPHEDPRISQFSTELQDVVLEHMGRGYLTRATLIGVLQLLVLDTARLLDEDEA